LSDIQEMDGFRSLKNDRFFDNYDFGVFKFNTIFKVIQ